jgi:hypothetical protein
MNISLLGCGILKKEVNYLIRKNNWRIKPRYLCSSLHVDFDKLETALTGSLKKKDNPHDIILYGTCHPSMDRFIEENQGIRIKGQNCVEQLLGRNLFDQYLSEGAFFLMEEWAQRWEMVMGEAFGNNPEIIREILTMEHNFLLALRTVCTAPYHERAEQISLKTGLPLRWLDVELDHLEEILYEGMQERINLYG